MRVGFIGAGRVGGNLAYWMSRSGWRISGLYDRDEARSKATAKLVPCGIFPAIPKLIKRTDLVFVTVPDDQLIGVVDAISETDYPGERVLVHTSGVHSASILKSAGPEFITYALHPFQTITPLGGNRNPFEGIIWGGEGEEKAYPLMNSIVSSWEGKLVTIRSEHKTLYHAAAVFGSNLLLSNIVSCVELLQTAGFREEESLKATLYIAGHLLDNVIRKGVCNSLTGPAVREDMATLAKHLVALQKTDKLALYEEATKNLLNTIERCQSKKNQAKEFFEDR
ncbi:DUF2520 domain-containing protein [bacterium]|nr:DUF2520 domain-containing protein [bacterium]